MVAPRVPGFPELPDLVSRQADVGGVRLHYVESGAEEGRPVVVLLHGFPEFWYSWRHQIPALVAAGFHVVAPDMRGYNLSDKPGGVASYALEPLTDDVAGLIRAVGAERASVVGHDWGGGVAWAFALRFPDRLDRLAVLNLPHPARLLRGFTTPRQLLKSAYMLFFQAPVLPEWALSRDNYAAVRAVFHASEVRPGAFSEQDIERYVTAIRRPGALTAALNYYRALFRTGWRQAPLASRKIEAPVLVIWGERDRFLGSELAEPDRALVPRARVARLPRASHWVQLDEPERVNQLLVDFLRS